MLASSAARRALLLTRPLPRRPIPAWVVSLIVLFGLAPRAEAQVNDLVRTGARFHPDSSVAAESLLRTADGLAQNKHWTEAVDIYQRVIDQFEGSVTRVSKEAPEGSPDQDSELYVDVRRHCQARLSALPPEARAIYRTRVDAQAKRWLDDGIARNDRALLRRVTSEAFCSSWGDDALDALGDLAFRDARFAEALACYRQIVPDEARPGITSPAQLVHPDPDVDRARVAAKKLLCRAAIGVDPPADEDLVAFAKAYPNAPGPFAGRTGPLLKGLAEALKSDGLAPASSNDGRWPTFAGAPSRTHIAPGTIDIGSFQWKVPLASVPRIRTTYLQQPFNNRFPTRAPAPRPDELLPYHPIVLGDQVVLSDANRIFAYNLSNRPLSGPPESSEADVPVAWEQTLPSAFGAPVATSLQGLPKYTLTAFGDRVYARLGPPGARQGPSYVLAVQNSREVEGKLLWRRSSADLELPKRRAGATNRYVAFEGTPLADEHDVYVALSEPGEMMPTYLVCLDAETGNPRWKLFLGEATAIVDNVMGQPFSDDVGGRMLTLDGPNLYYQTNLGAVVAVEAQTGTIRWLATYPHLEPRGATKGFGRDLNPAIVANGLVIVAPDDSPWIYAFDSATGHVAWRSDRKLEEVVHLLGVAQGRLVATGQHVFTLDVNTGEILSTWPETGSFESHGRGLLAGDQIYWPTKNEIHVLDQATGQQSKRGPIKLQEGFGTSGGNLVVGDGYLIIAQEETLVVFCQNGRLIERYRQQIADSPEKAALYVRLARVAEATGDDALALASLDQAIARARPSEVIDGQPLVEQANAQRFRLLMQLGQHAASTQEWAMAAQRFEAAALSGRSDRDRLRARLELARAQEAGEKPGLAVRTLQGLLQDARLSGLFVGADERRSMRADLLITERLETALESHGRQLYASYEQEARALLERGKATGDPRLLEEVPRTYPVAEVAPEALLALGAMQLEHQRPHEAARAYRRLLAMTSSDSLRAQALIGLGRAYELQGFLVPAHEMYVRAMSRYSQIRLEELGESVGSFVAERLGQPPLSRLAEELSEPSLPAPLSRIWAGRWNENARPISADGVPPSTGAGRVFLAEGQRLLPIDPKTGDRPWVADLGDDPIWVGFLADRVLAATATRVVALDVDTGEANWTFVAEDTKPGRRAPNPFARVEAPTASSNQVEGELSTFRIVGGRVYCLRGNHELLAIDGDTGLIDWSFTPGSGVLNPHFLAGPERLVVQVQEPNSVVLLEAGSGLVRREIPLSEDEQAWQRDPLPIDDDRIALVTDDRTVALLDLAQGVTAWTFHDPPALPRSGPPRLLGDSGRLLVLRDGSELVRLDPATGARIWSRVLGFEDLSEWPNALAIDGECVYCAIGGTLTAYSLEDGQPQWRKHLTGPATGWSLVLAERSVVAFPSPARSIEGELSTLPVAIYRRDSGRLIQRVVLRAPIDSLALRLAPGSAFVATQSGGWALGRRPESSTGERGIEGPRP